MNRIISRRAGKGPKPAKPRLTVIEGLKPRSPFTQTTAASRQMRNRFRLIIHPLVQLERKMGHPRNKSLAFFWNFHSIHHKAFERAYGKLAKDKPLDELKFFETVYCGIEAIASVDPGHSTRDPYLRPGELLLKWKDESKGVRDYHVIQMFRLGELALKLKSLLADPPAQTTAHSKITEQLRKHRYPYRAFDELSHVIRAYHDNIDNAGAVRKARGSG